MCSEQSERKAICRLIRRCGVPSEEDKPLWARVCYVGVVRGDAVVRSVVRRYGTKIWYVGVLGMCAKQISSG